MQAEFVFAGFGGQGVMFVGQLLAYAGMAEGLHVTWIPSYGPEMRGGTANCTVVLSDKPIGSPAVRHPKIVVAFNKPSFQKYEPLAAELLAVNTSLVTAKSHRTDLLILEVPATQLAEEVGNIKLANVVMLGAVLAVYPAVLPETLYTVLAKQLPTHRQHMLAQNRQAIERGAAAAALNKGAFSGIGC